MHFSLYRVYKKSHLLNQICLVMWVPHSRKEPSYIIKLKVIFIQKLLMRSSCPLKDEPNYFPWLEILKLDYLQKWLKCGCLSLDFLKKPTVILHNFNFWMIKINKTQISKCQIIFWLSLKAYGAPKLCTVKNWFNVLKLYCF